MIFKEFSKPCTRFYEDDFYNISKYNREQHITFQKCIILGYCDKYIQKLLNIYVVYNFFCSYFNILDI